MFCKRKWILKIEVFVAAYAASSETNAGRLSSDKLWLKYLTYIPNPEPSHSVQEGK